MSAQPTPDFVVVGAGVIGSSIAYHLARAGADVLLADPGAPRFPSASWASAGGVRRQNRDPREWPLTIEAARRWPQLEDELGADCEFRAGGHLHVVEDAEALDRIRERVAEQRAGGVDVELVDGNQAREIAPLLAVSVIGGMYTRGDGQANPRLTTSAFQRATARHGARWRGDAISGFATDNGRVVGVEFGAETVRARRTVLAAGSWSPALARTLGIGLPIRLQGLQMLLSDPDETTLAPTIGAEDRPISFKQLPTGAFLIGGGWPADVEEGTHRCALRQECVVGSWKTATELIPAMLRRELAQRWCGVESLAIDGVPFIGPLPEVEGLYVAAGFSGHGFQLSPAVGRAVADELLDQDVPELRDLAASRMVGIPPTVVESFVAGGPARNSSAGATDLPRSSPWPG